jgi:hypothetical protein
VRKQRAFLLKCEEFGIQARKDEERSCRGRHDKYLLTNQLGQTIIYTTSRGATKQKHRADYNERAFLKRFASGRLPSRGS